MFLGIDLGTGSVKVALVDRSGQVVHTTSRAYECRSPRPGYAEIHPDVWWEKTVDAVRECCADHGQSVAGIGLSGQAHGFVLIDASGKALRPGILWPDLRTRREIAEIAGYPHAVLRPLCNPVTTGMMGPGLAWIRRNEPDVFSAAYKAVSPKDWLKLKLTGAVSTEPSDASMTLLYDMVADTWSDEMLGRLDLTSDLLPTIGISTDTAATLRPGAAEALSLPAGIPVSGGLADCAACLLGMGIKAPGDTVLQIGSGIQIMTMVDSPTPEVQPFYNTFRAVGDGVYKMAALQNGGTAFEWVRRLLNADWNEMYDAAFEPDPGTAGVTFLPYASGERAPILDPDASASFTNMRLDCSRENLIRAAFEGVAMAIRDSWEALARTGVAAEEILLTGGGSSDPRWRQLVADVLRVPLTVADARANATTGAAFLGGMAAGHWGAIEDLPIAGRTGERVSPSSGDAFAEKLDRFRATYAGLKAAR